MGQLARALNANIRNLNLGKESGEPYAGAESKEVSDLHFNKKIHLEAKIIGEGDGWKSGNKHKSSCKGWKDAELRQK